MRCKGYKIVTLLWTKGGRGFNDVGYVAATSGEVTVTSKLFPNTQYGYNKRECLVSTLPVRDIIFVTTQFVCFFVRSFVMFALEILILSL